VRDRPRLDIDPSDDATPIDQEVTGEAHLLKEGVPR